jgi:hypothetical protein
MAVASVFLGHWRALEDRWVTEFNSLRNRKTVAVVTAGQSVANRLVTLATGEAAGVQFLPGFPALSKVLSNSVTGKSIPKPQLIAVASQIGYRPETAGAAAVFFEKLIEMGVTADSFSVIACSTKGLHSEVLKTADRFAAYSSLRNSIHRHSPDRIYAEGPVNSSRFSTYMFYGFYDLNPAQRKYVKRLSKDADIVWFSPVHPSHHWRETSSRTLNFLKTLITGSIVRVDADWPLSSTAQFAENLLTGKTPGSTAMDLLQCSSGLGFTRAVIDKVKELLKAHSSNDIAIVATGEDAGMIVDQLHIADISCASPLSANASTLPAGRFLERLLNLGENRFHHRDIEKLLLTGVVSMKGTPDAHEYAKKARETGSRFGLSSLRATEFPFASVVADFFLRLPDNAYPAEYLSQVTELLAQLCRNSVPTVFTDSVLLPDVFKFNQSVAFDVFKEMMHVALDVPVKLKEPEKDGVAVLSPERTRGILKKALIVTGIEEGVFPGAVVNDPRLPAEVKRQLQFPPAELRETEEAFLLRQVFEAAEKTISVIWRSSDSSGRPLALSPFLVPLLKDDCAVEVTRLSNSPPAVLSIPERPPFLASSVECQKERIRFVPENPSPDAVHCGMIGPGIFPFDKISASMLESYVRNPFSFLQNRVWQVAETDEFPVRSEPDPLAKGNIVHKCVETVLKRGDEPADVVRTICNEYNLTALLGSETLAEIWMKHLADSAGRLVSKLEEMNWSFVESEKELCGTVAGFPATGRIDLILKNARGEFILADLKTGRPGTLKNTRGVTIIENGLFQLPFYRDLAVQNGYRPLSEAVYIHLQRDGSLEFRSLSDTELQGIHTQFESKVNEIHKAISVGDFHPNPKKNRQGAKP